MRIYVTLLEAELCLVFSIATGTRGFNSSVLGFIFPVRNFGLPHRESSFWSSFSYNLMLLYWSPVGMVLRYGEERVFYNLKIKSQFSGGPVSLWAAVFLIYFLKALTHVDYVPLLLGKIKKNVGGAGEGRRSLFQLC